MKRLRIYIVEDEPLICATIETALQKQGFEVIGDNDCVREALQDIQRLSPELVLLDINLEGDEDGVDLAKKLDTLNIPYIYLTSQTDPSTITRVKETHPLGYIVKPFTESGLRSNIELAWHNFSIQNEEFLLIKSDGRLLKLSQNDILYCKAYDNYCFVVTKLKRHLIPHTLKYVEEKLNSKNFIRSHRSYVVNLRKVQALVKDVVIIDGLKIPLSQRNKDMLKNRIALI